MTSGHSTEEQTGERGTAERPTGTTTAVIPGHDCASSIERCLEALLPLLAAGELHEIIFVDDHSTDGTPERVRRFDQVRMLRSPTRGAGAARNVGWRAAQAEQIWFVDADCVVRPDALRRLQRRALELDAGAVGGSYDNLWPGRLVADLIHEEMVGRHRSMGDEVSAVITANLLCRRRLLEQLDGFDESLRLGQDLDLAYRIVESGARLGFDADSRVGHFHETRLLRYLIKQARQGYWRVHIYARHPRRVTGDSYAGPSDYVQPPLGVVVLFAGVAGVAAPSALLRRGASLLLGSSSLALLLLQLPRTAQLVARSQNPRLLAYAPMAVARAGFRGVGMLAGMLSLARSRLGRGRVV